MADRSCPTTFKSAPGPGRGTAEPPPLDELDPTDLQQVRFRRLRELGLTEYQARAYAALTRLGHGTATELARAAGVPRNKLYPVMQQLNRLGLAETRLGEAQVFRPLPLDRFVEERVGAMRARAEALERERGGLAALFRPAAAAAEAGAGAVRLYHGRANTVEQVRLALRNARERLDLAPGFGGAARMLASGEAALLQERLEEGLAARVALPPGAPQATELAEVLPGAVRATGLPGGALVLVGDGRDLVLAQLQPDDGAATAGEDVCLVAVAPALARTWTHAVDLAWAAGAAVAAGAGPAPEAPSRTAR